VCHLWCLFIIIQMFLWLSIASINGGVLSWVAAFLVLCRISVPYWKKLRYNDFFCSNIFNGLSKCRRRRFVWSPFKTKVSSVLPWLCLVLSFYVYFRPSFSLHIDLAISLVCIRRIREVFSIFIANFGRAGKGAFGLCVALFSPFFPIFYLIVWVYGWRFVICFVCTA